MNRNHLLTLTLGVGLGLAACKSDGAKPEDTATPKAEPAKPKAEAAKPTVGGEMPEGALEDPSKADLTAPEEFTVKLDTTEGPILIDVKREWAPKGADRIYNLVRAGYFEDVAFFRVIDGFMAQVGIHGDPDIAKVWRNARIEDDPVKQSNTRGMVSFATAGPNTRTTQFFINYGNNGNLDGMGFAPFGKVRDMAPVDALYAEYGEGAPRGKGPSQGRLQSEGNTYLKADFPELDYIVSAEIVE